MSLLEGTAAIVNDLSFLNAYRVNSPALQQDGALVRTSQPPWSLAFPALRPKAQNRTLMQFAPVDNRLTVKLCKTAKQNNAAHATLHACGIIYIPDSLVKLYSCIPHAEMHNSWAESCSCASTYSFTST